MAELHIAVHVLPGAPGAGHMSPAVTRVRGNADESDAPQLETPMPCAPGEERRHGADRRHTETSADDLYGRLEDKRQAIERERREFVRRLIKESDNGQ
jgi:hypothetical protein